tara:strand:+ start:2590 stop:3012 length:423 start_codon:yes stop_codon:yes gene_type:complete
MIYINILHGAPCVGKSKMLTEKVSGVYKLDMTNCNYWLFQNPEWGNVCINYMIENIINNLHRSDMAITCGGLPHPEHYIYSQLEHEYSVKFVHTLVLVKDLEKYKQYVKEQKKPDQVVTILKEYSLRVASNNVYDETIYI